MSDGARRTSSFDRGAVRADADDTALPQADVAPLSVTENPAAGADELEPTPPRYPSSITAQRRLAERVNRRATQDRI
jgi:hypothetical protein